MCYRQGMVYLHKSVFHSHGYLSSANCQVDSRWVLKVSGFALHSFRKDKQVHINIFLVLISFVPKERQTTLFCHVCGRPPLYTYSAFSGRNWKPRVQSIILKIQINYYLHHLPLPFPLFPIQLTTAPLLSRSHCSPGHSPHSSSHPLPYPPMSFCFLSYGFSVEI